MFRTEHVFAYTVECVCNGRRGLGAKLMFRTEHGFCTARVQCVDDGAFWLWTSRNSQARANDHNRSTVLTEISNSRAASSCVNPAKKHSFTTSAARASNAARPVSASSKA